MFAVKRSLHTKLVPLVQTEVNVYHLKAIFLLNVTAPKVQVQKYAASFLETQNGKIILKQSRNTTLRLKIVTTLETLKVYATKTI